MAECVWEIRKRSVYAILLRSVESDVHHWSRAHTQSVKERDDSAVFMCLYSSLLSFLGSECSSVCCQVVLLGLILGCCGFIRINHGIKLPDHLLDVWERLWLLLWFVPSDPEAAASGLLNPVIFSGVVACASGNNIFTLKIDGLDGDGGKCGAKEKWESHSVFCFCFVWFCFINYKVFDRFTGISMEMPP